MNRLHIVILGACNSGKSTVANILTGQKMSLVSPLAGTTTDPVRKVMELPLIGPAVVIDTAGFDDETPLGKERIELTQRTLDEADAAILLVGKNPDVEAEWRKLLKARKIPFVELESERTADEYMRRELIESILRVLPEDFGKPSLLRNLAGKGDVVVLVMPQDGSAPKDRLILPQVQTTRALLDAHAVIVSTQPETLPLALSSLSVPPKLIITDSQVFAMVAPLVPDETMLTSFSVLMAALKGDIDYFAESAKTIGVLTENSRVLIAEACTHAPQSEDIGRVKIPAMLRRRIGSQLAIDHCSGRDFPEDLSGYDLVIHCGACMFNRSYVLSRVERAKKQNVPMTNYGIAIAWLTNILDKVSW